MSYKRIPNGYAATDPRAANALDFLDALGGAEYDEARKFVDCTGLVPDWLAAKMRGKAGEWRKFKVAHKMEEYEVAAKSVEHAINCVRFRIYGARPADTLPPFSATEIVEHSTLSRHIDSRPVKRIAVGDIRKRLSRLQFTR